MLSLAFSLLFTGTLSGDYYEEDMCAEWWGYPLNTCIESSKDSDHEYSWGLYCDADGKVIKKQWEVLECNMDSEYTEEVYCDPEDPHLGYDHYDTTTDYWWYYWYYGNDTTTWYWPTYEPESTMSYEWHDCGCDYDPCSTATHTSGYCDDTWYWEYKYILDTTCYSFDDSDWAYHYRRRTRRMKEKMRRLVDSDSFNYVSFETNCDGETYYYEEPDCEGEGMTWEEWWEQYYTSSTWGTETDYDYPDYTTDSGYTTGDGGYDGDWTTWYDDNYWCEDKDECTDTENSCMYYEYSDYGDCDGGEDDGGEDDGGEDDGGNDDTTDNTSEPEDTSEPGGDGGAQGLITSVAIVLSILGLIVN